MYHSSCPAVWEHPTVLCTRTLRSSPLFPSPPSNDQGLGAFFCWWTLGVAGLLGQGVSFLCGVRDCRAGCRDEVAGTVAEQVQPVAAVCLWHNVCLGSCLWGQLHSVRVGAVCSGSCSASVASVTGPVSASAAPGSACCSVCLPPRFAGQLGVGLCGWPAARRVRLLQQWDAPHAAAGGIDTQSCC